MKTILNILACILIYGSGAATGFVSARIYRNYCLRQAKPVQVENEYIPSAHQIQQRLKETGNPRYDPGKIDGVIGINTKSQTAWDNFTCDQFAKREIEQ